MAPPRKWPKSPTELEDRSTVVHLVQHVGRKKLVFSAVDLRREMNNPTGPKLHHSGQLGRHLQDLGSQLVTKVGQRLATGSNDGARARHQFVLTERRAEYQAGGTALDDLERVLHALWVAVDALGVAGVPTRAVTSVLQSIEPLALDTPRNTANHLATLRNRRVPLAEARNATNHTRHVLWSPLGPRPNHPEFPRWVKEYKTIAADEAEQVQLGHATLGAVAAELVEIGLERSKSSTWPAGRSVRIEGIRSAIGSDSRAEHLNASLLRRGASLGSVLGDVTKKRIAGAERVHRRVMKTPALDSGGSYYDIPDKAGYERRRLIVPYDAAREHLRQIHLHDVERGFRAAEKLAASAQPIIRAIGAVSCLLVLDDVQHAEPFLQDLEKNSLLLSKKIRASVAEMRKQLSRILSRFGSLPGLAFAAEQALAQVGSSVDACRVERPLMFAGEYVSFLPQNARTKERDIDVLNLVVALRRWPNPDFVHQHETEDAAAHRLGVDRADALLYLAERYQGRVRNFLKQGERLIGRYFRDPVLLRMLFETSTSALERRAALAGLTLLGDADALYFADSLLHSATASPQEKTDALSVLLVMKELDPAKIPAQLFTEGNAAFQTTVNQVVLASRMGRWLL